ncbi:CMGC/CLK protein kinase [Flagelloscypha sp. PMI_526]|nr:CMGC/CLK protein kinase [Flagelloscypha sp. PMI_526]
MISISREESERQAKRSRNAALNRTRPSPLTVSPELTITPYQIPSRHSVVACPLFTLSPVHTRARAAKEAESAAALIAANGAMTPTSASTETMPLLPPLLQSQRLLRPTFSSKATPACDDKEGHYTVMPDDLIFNRYRTAWLSGRTSSPKPLEPSTQRRRTESLLKSSTLLPGPLMPSFEEEYHSTVIAACHCCAIHLLHWFDHRNHICIVTELLGMCLYDFLKDNRFEPFPRHQIQSFAHQLLGSMAFLHDLKLVHTDLKPENILLVRNDYHTTSLPVPGKRSTKTKRILMHTDIHLIDFGSATFEEEYHSTVISTRHYRAPEIILGLGWSYPCDVYSLSCILVEFYTGNALFQTHDNLEHLAMMEKVMNLMPDHFARAGYRSKPEFFKEVGGAPARLDWPKPKASQQTKKDVEAMKTLSDGKGPNLFAPT